MSGSPPQKAFMLPVKDPALWIVGAMLLHSGHQWLVVGKDVSQGVIFVQPIGTRKERREAIRKVFR